MENHKILLNCNWSGGGGGYKILPSSDGGWGLTKSHSCGYIPGVCLLKYSLLYSISPSVMFQKKMSGCHMLEHF